MATLIGTFLCMKCPSKNKLNVNMKLSLINYMLKHLRKSRESLSTMSFKGTAAEEGLMLDNGIRGWINSP